TAKPVVDFHHQVIAHAERTKERAKALSFGPKSSKVKTANSIFGPKLGREWAVNRVIGLTFRIEKTNDTSFGPKSG
ncbi:hypothetical protein, partial [Tetragenococcus halophilus]